MGPGQETGDSHSGFCITYLNFSSTVVLCWVNSKFMKLKGCAAIGCVPCWCLCVLLPTHVNGSTHSSYIIWHLEEIMVAWGQDQSRFSHPMTGTLLFISNISLLLSLQPKVWPHQTCCLWPHSSSCIQDMCSFCYIHYTPNEVKNKCKMLIFPLIEIIIGQSLTGQIAAQGLWYKKNKIRNKGTIYCSPHFAPHFCFPRERSYNGVSSFFWHLPPCSEQCISITAS